MKCAQPRQKPRGIALIIVMVAIFVLSVLIGGFAYSMKVETKLAMNANQESDLIWLGRSGVEFARWVLVQQTSVPGEPYDALNQKWAGGTGTLATSNSPLAGVSLENYQIGKGVVSIRIIDNERKFNINQVSDELLQRALTAVGIDAGEIPGISASIIDWIDADDVTRVNGTESDYYESLPTPYLAKNRPMDDLSELLLVRGVMLDMYWGSASTNHLAAAFQQVDRWGRPVASPVYPIGLVEVFTALSNGRINVNTASAQTLQIIPFVDESGAARIVQQRAGPDGVDGTEDDLPFRNPGEAGMLLNDAVAQQFSRYGTTRSSVFEVVVDAALGDYRRTFYATLARVPPRDVQVLSFRWE